MKPILPGGFRVCEDEARGAEMPPDEHLPTRLKQRLVPGWRQRSSARSQLKPAIEDVPDTRPAPRLRQASLRARRPRPLRELPRARNRRPVWGV